MLSEVSVWCEMTLVPADVVAVMMTGVAVEEEVDVVGGAAVVVGAVEVVEGKKRFSWAAAEKTNRKLKRVHFRTGEKGPNWRARVGSPLGGVNLTAFIRT